MRLKLNGEKCSPRICELQESENNGFTLVSSTLKTSLVFRKSSEDSPINLSFAADMARDVKNLILRLDCQVEDYETGKVTSFETFVRYS